MATAACLLLAAGCADAASSARANPSAMPGEPARPGPGPQADSPLAGSPLDGRPLDGSTADGSTAARSAAASRPGNGATQVRLLVRDGDLRVAGSDCSGGGGYRHLHRTARFALTAANGQPLAHGTLPSGRARPALAEDTGNARVVPTFCEFDFAVDAPRAGGYQLLVGDERPIPLTVSGQILAAQTP